MARGGDSLGGLRLRRGWWGAPVAVAGGLALAASVLAASPASVAIVVGKPIARQELNHWMVISAKAEAGPLIVPTDPPRFRNCIVQVRARIPSLRPESTEVLRKDCRQLFAALSSEVLDFLIRADWQETAAAGDGIVITVGQVDRTFAAAKQKQFPKPGAFRRYLRRSGETVADAKFRVRANLVFAALRTAEHLSGNALQTELTRRFKSRTTCARFYVMSDCARRASSAGTD